MIMNDYQKIIRENFDISDDTTRKQILALEANDETQLLAALSSALYEKIVNKVDKIDFGTIPRSRGDITKVEGFDNTMECLDIMRKLVLEYKENPAIIDTLITCVENIKSRKALFMKAFMINAELPTVIYNLMVLSMEQCVSFLIAVCIQYIKDPSSQSMSAALDKVAYNNSRDNVLYQQIVSFNETCVSKELDQALDTAMKSAKVSEDIQITISHDDKPSIKMQPKEGVVCAVCGQFPCVCPAGNATPDDADNNVEVINGACDKAKSVDEDGIGSVINQLAAPVKGIIGTAAVLGGTRVVIYIIKMLIPMLRNITYNLFHLKAKWSDTLAVQAQLIEANAYRLQYSSNSDMDEEKKKKVVEKQLKIAEKLKDWANRLSIDYKKAEKNASQEMAADKTKYKTSELPANMVAGLF